MTTSPSSKETPQVSPGGSGGSVGYDARTGELESTKRGVVGGKPTGGEIVIVGPPEARWWIGTAEDPPPDDLKSTTLATGLFSPGETTVVHYLPWHVFPVLVRVRHPMAGSLFDGWVEPGSTVHASAGLPDRIIP